MWCWLLLQNANLRRRIEGPLHRTVTQAGGHVKTIESIELSIKTPPKLFQRFKTFNNKRDKSVYNVAGAVSDQESEAMIKLTNKLKNTTPVWMKEFHPELPKT